MLRKLLALLVLFLVVLAVGVVLFARGRIGGDAVRRGPGLPTPKQAKAQPISLCAPFC